MKDDAGGNRQIAIDGPAGAGKSTVAKKVAKRLGFLYLDTGAMYRALTYKVLKEQVPLDDESRISGLAWDTKIHFSQERKVWCDGEDVTLAIRTPEVSRAVSVVSAYPEVRKRMVDLQRAEAGRQGVVMDGRDIGTHVLPEARLKIFLTASPDARAKRRWLEFKRLGKEASLAEVKRDIEERDLKDASRATAPLQAAPDAFVLDTTNLNVEETVGKILAMVGEV